MLRLSFNPVLLLESQELSICYLFYIFYIIVLVDSLFFAMIDIQCLIVYTIKYNTCNCFYISIYYNSLLLNAHAVKY